MGGGGGIDSLKVLFMMLVLLHLSNCLFKNNYGVL